MDQQQAKLKELVKIISGFQSRSTIEAESEGSHHLLQIRDYSEDRNTIDVNSIIRFSPKSIREEQFLRGNDIIFLAKGAKIFAQVPRHLPEQTIPASYFYILRPMAEIDSEYVAWFLNRANTRQWISRQSGAGAHMPVVRRGVLENLVINIPPKKTQGALVAVSQLINKEQQLYTELAEKRAQYLNALCSQIASQQVI